MIGKLICLLTKHKRGRAIECVGIHPDWKITYECPRCKAQWTRKRREK